MMDVSWMNFFPLGNLSTHLIHFLKLNYFLSSHIRNGRCSCAWLIFNKWCERFISIFTNVIFSPPLFQATISYTTCTDSICLVQSRNERESEVRGWNWKALQFMAYSFEIFLWSHIKLPRDVIISLMYRYRLHNFIGYQQDFMPGSLYSVPCKRGMDNYYIVQCLFASLPVLRQLTKISEDKVMELILHYCIIFRRKLFINSSFNSIFAFISPINDGLKEIYFVFEFLRENNSKHFKVDWNKQIALWHENFTCWAFMSFPKFYCYVASWKQEWKCSKILAPKSVLAINFPRIFPSLRKGFSQVKALKLLDFFFICFKA